MSVDRLAGATRTAIIVPVSEAEVVVGPYRRVLDHTASWPVPAHVTVLYPFVAPDRITESVIDDVRACLVTVPTFTCMFSHVGWFGQDVVWLAPDPDASFRALTEVVVRRFPECLPYRGAHPDPTPHLTVGSTRLADLDGMQRAATDLRAKLPIHARIDCVRLIAGADTPGSWRTVSEFALPPA
ncbi:MULTISPECIES: 2'-5' RNA ligase family protein [unclassified Streptomyces]|uniref:2'-5' RNA ligase family protein n=1 Tax=unclassified Streptomyces TaxID=2593676 RepID=UPI0033C7D334